MQKKYFGKTFRLSGTVRILYTVKNDVRGGIKEKIRIEGATLKCYNITEL